MKKPSDRREIVTLVVVNVAIVYAAELLGGGSFFYETRALDVLAFFFVLLAAVRISGKYGMHDPVVRRFLNSGAMAMVMIAATHLIAWGSERYLRLSDRTVTLNSVNLYVISFLILAVGTEIILGNYDRKERFGAWAGLLGFVILTGFTIYNIGANASLPLSGGTLLPFLYLAAIVALGLVGTYRLSKLRAIMPFLAPFVDQLVVAMALIMLGAMPLLGTELLAVGTSLPTIQVWYLSHFAVFASLSVIFVAFGRMKELGGVYRDLKEAEAKQ